MPPRRIRGGAEFVFAAGGGNAAILALWLKKAPYTVNGLIPMHGVPENLDLSDFVGCVLGQICLDQYQVELHFYPDGSFFVEGKWELTDGDGKIVDRWEEHATREVYRLHRCLGSAVMDYSIDAPKSLCLNFDNGLNLRIFDSSKESESFNIQPGDIAV